MEKKRRGGRPRESDPKSERLSIRVDGHIREMLEYISDETGKSMGEVVRLALQKYVKEYFS